MGKIPSELCELLCPDGEATVVPAAIERCHPHITTTAALGAALQHPQFSYSSIKICRLCYAKLKDYLGYSANDSKLYRESEAEAEQDSETGQPSPEVKQKVKFSKVKQGEEHAVVAPGEERSILKPATRRTARHSERSPGQRSKSKETSGSRLYNIDLKTDDLLRQSSPE